MSKRSSQSRTAREDLILRRAANHRLFRAMLAHQGIDAARGLRDCEEKLFAALRTCVRCPAPESCRSWLAEKHPRGTYPEFCKNGTVIESCRDNLDVGVLWQSVAEPSTSVLAEGAFHGILADLMIQQFVAPEHVRAFNRVPRSGILAELDELAGRVL